MIPRSLPLPAPGPFNIIAIDGGGIRGVFTARLLQRLARHRPGLLRDASMFAGTSTGGILALGLAAGLSPAALEALYVNQAADIFRKRWFGGLWHAKYSAKPLRAAIEGTFGEQRIGDLRKLVLVAAYDLDSPEVPGRPRTGKAKFFETVDDADEFVVNAAVATAAAPTYFESTRGYIDGGVVAINPSMAAAAQAIAWGRSLGELRILSLGTGVARGWIDGDVNDWGLAQWAPKLADLLIDGVGGVADFQCAQIFGNAYARLDGPLPKPIGMDDVSAIPKLLELAENIDLALVLAWLDASGWSR